MTQNTERTRTINIKYVLAVFFSRRKCEVSPSPPKTKTQTSVRARKKIVMKARQGHIKHVCRFQGLVPKNGVGIVIWRNLEFYVLRLNQPVYDGYLVFGRILMDATKHHTVRLACARESTATAASSDQWMAGCNTVRISSRGWRVVKKSRSLVRDREIRIELRNELDLNLHREASTYVSLCKKSKSP